LSVPASWLEQNEENPSDHLSPLGWEHINLTGAYVWHASKRMAKDRFRPLRNPKEATTRLFTPEAAAIAVGRVIVSLG
jgi:hypothetical protein